MGDIHCRICGEPWDAYGVRNGDMEDWEAKLFLSGQGCPSCHFGRDKEKTIGDHEEKFLETLTSETDEDPIELLMNVKPKPKKTPEFCQTYQCRPDRITGQCCCFAPCHKCGKETYHINQHCTTCNTHLQ